MKRLEEVVCHQLPISYATSNNIQFDKYYIPPASPPAASLSKLGNNYSDINTTTPSAHYGSSYLLEAVQSFCQQEKAVGSPRDELKWYLESGQESTDNVIGWWGHQTDLRYPMMHWIARDYLAIQGSDTPLERAFSSGGITDTAC